jgi:hypothetical protein
MPVHRDYETGEELEVTSRGYHFAIGGDRDVKGKLRSPVVIPAGSRSSPPCQGDYPEWTEEEVKNYAIANGADPDEWVKLWKDESRYNETMLTRGERAKRHQTKEQQQLSDTEFQAAVDAEIARRAEAKKLSDDAATKAAHEAAVGAAADARGGNA